MDKNTVVIAIDHGWSNMKTVHETFTSGIREIPRSRHCLKTSWRKMESIIRSEASD